jgi:hypothetical protein
MNLSIPESDVPHTELRTEDGYTDIIINGSVMATVETTLYSCDDSTAMPLDIIGKLQSTYNDIKFPEIHTETDIIEYLTLNNSDLHCECDLTERDGICYDDRWIIFKIKNNPIRYFDTDILRSGNINIEIDACYVQGRDEFTICRSTTNLATRALDTLEYI